MNSIRIVPSDPVDPYAAIADELRRLADGFATLAGRGLSRPHVSLGVHVGPIVATEAQDATVVATVDAAGMALVGRPGRLDVNEHGKWSHMADWSGRPVYVAVRGPVTNPEDREQERARTELVELRKEVARLRTERESNEGAGRD